MEQRYRSVGKALDAVMKYESLQPTVETPLEDMKRMNVKKEWYDHVGSSMDILGRAVNGSSPQEVAEAMYLGIHGDHRTIQAQVVLSILKFLEIYQDASFDLRNERAVRAATKISQYVKDEFIMIPLI
jgi:hypothetical protein